MLSIQQPSDIVSLAIFNILSYRKDDKYYNLVKDWNKVILIHVEEFYPVLVIFRGTEISFEKDGSKKANLKVKMSLNTMMDIAYGRMGPIKGVLTRKIKIKGILKVGLLLKFMKIFLNSMKILAKDPNLNYYEIDKSIK